MEHLLWTVHCSSHFAGRNWLSLTTAQEVSYTMSSQYRRGIWRGEKLSDLGAWWSLAPLYTPVFTRITWALCLALSEGHSFQDGNFCRLQAVFLVSLDLFTEFAQKRCLLESSRNPVKDINMYQVYWEEEDRVLWKLGPGRASFFGDRDVL